jgi:hypothetical protein
MFPLGGRNLIRARLEEVGANFQWREVNGQHAFLRDEGRATTRPWPITATGWCSNYSTAGSARATSPTEALTRCRAPTSGGRGRGDSLLEEGRFEPSVPARKTRFLLRKANCGTERRQPKRVFFMRY